MNNITHNIILDKLNNKQLEAVTNSNGTILVLAGAGSGKTRVLVHRVAWLLSKKGYSPYSIMAVTFTNKAANELRSRIKYLVNINTINNFYNGMWIETFHSLAYKLLRIHYMDINLPQDFQILDTNDQKRLLKRLISTLNLDEKKWSLNKAMWYINTRKDKGLRPCNIENYNNLSDNTWLRIYQAYQNTCDRSGLVDFAELLLRAHELWLNNPDILCHYRKRFTNILIDEFQDTNKIQYAWIRLLINNESNVMIVGDDDQSIYGWRGAQVENISRFLKDFPATKSIYLEQNYRSTSNIVKAANVLISHNRSRLTKNLWTNISKGEFISFYCAFNEIDEAYFVIQCIKKWKEKGGLLNNCAILYRNNAQSRIFEEILVKFNIPYIIYGGVRFFERQEIKDALAYLRLISNRNDDAAYERIINIPNRGIGSSTLNIIRQNACDLNLTLWQVSLLLLQNNLLSKRASLALQKFINLINKLAQDVIELPLHILTKQVIKNSGLWNMYMQEKGERGRIRIENLKELITTTQQYNNKNNNDDIISLLQEFLSCVILKNEDKQSNSYQDVVQMMTIHSAKGLEFSQIFIVGMEEGLFPSQISLKEGKLEEERRLMYVAITRAMKKLTISYAKSRHLYGKKIAHQPSRFINEIPQECVKIYSCVDTIRYI